MNIFLFIFSVLTATASQTTSHVEFSQFKQGASWIWVYSEWSKKDNAWAPYFREKYTLTEAKDKILTFEMSSGPIEGELAPPHHKIVVDFTKCEKASADPKMRNFSVEFYTQSFGGGWKVVSKNHKNLVFTEKFNCAGPMNFEKVVFSVLNVSGTQQPTFQKQPGSEASWYFLNFGQLTGVAASKDFEPKGDDYKMEFFSYCSPEEAC